MTVINDPVPLSTRDATGRALWARASTRSTVMCRELFLHKGWFRRLAEAAR